MHPPPSVLTCGFLIQLVFFKKKTMWFIGVEVEQETSAPPPKKTPGSAPVLAEVVGQILFSFTRSVTEHYNPEEPEFTAEFFGYDPLESTGREWYGSLEERERQSASMKRGTSLERFLRFHPYDNGNNYYY